MFRDKNMFFLIVAFMLVCTSAYAYDNPSGSDKWQIQVNPYFFAPGLEGDLTVNGQTATVDLSFDDILDNFDVIGFSNRVVARKGKLGLIFDIAYVGATTEVKLETLAPPSSIGVDVDIADLSLDFGVSYRVVDTIVAGKRLWIEPLGGLRYHYFKQEIDLNVDVTFPPPVGAKSRGATLGGDEDWVEPFVGGLMGIDLTDKFSFLLRGDAGGFGMGDASDLTWNILAGLDYRFSQRASVKLGYRFQGFDYETGSGAERFGADLDLNGPMLGAIIRF
jgi:opacity protein-like surface antigen